MNLNTTSSVFDFIKLNTQNFIKHNINNAKLESELILCNLFNCDRINLYTDNNKNINHDQFIIISDYIKRRISGEPIQYILGNAHFYGSDFFVNKHVLIPRFDSELIIDILKKQPKANNLLEIGTGSGNLAITIAKEDLAKNIIATDISKNQLCPNLNIKLIVDDFLNSKINKKFDIIVSNPPYISKKEICGLDPLVKNNEPLNSLTDGNDGYDFYKQFALSGEKILNKHGFMLLEIGINNKLEILKKIFYNYNVEVFNDFNKISRVIKIH